MLSGYDTAEFVCCCCNRYGSCICLLWYWWLLTFVHFYAAISLRCHRAAERLLVHHLFFHMHSFSPHMLILPTATICKNNSSWIIYYIVVGQCTSTIQDNNNNNANIQVITCQRPHQYHSQQGRRVGILFMRVWGSVDHALFCFVAHKANMYLASLCGG